VIGADEARGAGRGGGKGGRLSFLTTVGELDHLQGGCGKKGGGLKKSAGGVSCKNRLKRGKTFVKFSLGIKKVHVRKAGGPERRC